MRYPQEIQLSESQLLDLISEDKREWCRSNHVQLRSDSQYRVDTQYQELCIYSLVRAPLYTYYMLRWGHPQKEFVET